MSPSKESELLLRWLLLNTNILKSVIQFDKPWLIRSIVAKNTAVELFDKWADLGRDKGMEEGHSYSVELMMKRAIERVPENFIAIDVGCGNGWAVRKLAQEPECSQSCGVDGAESMISKARSIDPKGEYFVGKLPGWTPQRKVDLVMSMEFIYYLEEPSYFICELYDKWLSPGGTIAIGLDHYSENEESLSWPDSLGVHMSTLSISEWELVLKNAGFTDLEVFQATKDCANPGTLILIGSKV